MPFQLPTVTHVHVITKYTDVQSLAFVNHTNQPNLDIIMILKNKSGAITSITLEGEEVNTSSLAEHGS